MIKPGIYRVYRIHPEQDSHHQLIGRFIVTLSAIYLLEDHFGLKDIFNPGALTGRTLNRIKKMAKSPYFKIVSEGDVEQGLHPDGIEELDVDPGVDWGN